MTSTMNTDGLVWHIQIQKGQTFHPHKWRDAIRAYLDGVWREDLVLADPPKFALDGHWFRLDVAAGEYFAYTSPETIEAKIPDPHGEVLIIGNQKDEVEVGLARFVRNNHIGQLAIIFRDSNSGQSSSFVLTKARQRSALFVATRNIPWRETALRKRGLSVW